MPVVDPLENEMPSELRAAFDHAVEKIGWKRALIALQGILHRYSRLQFIDGLLRRETIKALRVAVAKIGIDRLVEIYQDRLKERFPAEFAEPVAEEISDDTPVEVADEPVTRKLKRRRAE